MTSLLTCGEDMSQVGAQLMIFFHCCALTGVFLFFTRDALFLDGVLFSTACT